MNNLFGILKISFINNLGLNALFNKELSKEDKKKAMKTTSMIIVMMATILILATLYSNIIAVALDNINLLYVLPFVAALISVLINFFTSIYKASGILFSSRDYDLLMSLPISNRTILASKIIELVSFNIGITALIIVPTTIVYFIRSESSPICFIYMLIGILILPLIPIVLSSIFAFAINFVSSKIRFSKTFTVVGTGLIFCGIMIASMKANDLIQYVMEKADTLISIFQKLYPPSAWFADALVNNQIISLCKFILISIIPFIFFIIVFSTQFKKINSRLNESYKRSNYEMTSLKVDSISKAMLKIEFKKFFSSMSYVMNTVILQIMLIVLSIGFLVSPEDVLNSLPIEVTNMMLPIVIAMFCLLIGMGSTTLSTISFEGTSFWILKTLPVKAKDIFVSKILVNIILSVPSIIISSVIIKFGVELSIIECIWLVVIPTLFTVFISIAGIFINLKFPKLEWTQEIQAVKNTTSVTVGIVLTFVSVAICAGMYLLFNAVNINISLSLISLVIMVLIFIAWNKLNSEGTKLFNKL